MKIFRKKRFSRGFIHPPGENVSQTTLLKEELFYHGKLIPDQKKPKLQIT
jgi:hypothetical protein